MNRDSSGQRVRPAICRTPRYDPSERRHRENAVESAKQRLPDCGRVGNQLFEAPDRACRRMRTVVARMRQSLQPAGVRIASRSYGLGKAEMAAARFNLTLQPLL